MAESSGRRPPAWAAFLAGAVAVLALVLAWVGWNRTHRAADLAAAAIEQAPDLSRPRLPATPHTPDTPPVPRPK